ncbi:MAG TPA: VWA domain-containing protein [Acidobacteriota bacterium]|nr:VWA domain-containing protein [Acidobacteriota bacterium]
MRKSLIVIGIFAVLAVVALVYGLQQFGVDTVSGIPHPVPPSGSPGTIDPNTVPGLVTSQDSNIQFEWKLDNPYIYRNGNGDAFLDLRVTGKPIKNSDRKRMNLVLVIDRSGSMGSENKLEQVKNSAIQLLNNLDPEDRLAIITYDDSIQTLLPSTTVEDKARVRDLIYSLSPGGSTNLCGGMQAGFEEAKRHFRNDIVNRIVLLSDGLANVGIVDPTAIASEAQRIRENRISVSTMGVGVDYNENLMASIADHSGGNYYYISNETNMASVFQKELNLMQSLIGTNAKATFELGRGIQVTDIAGYKWSQSGRKLTIQVPDVYSGETKRILVQLKVPTTAGSSIVLGNGQFVCTDISQKKPFLFTADFRPSVKVVSDIHMVEKNEDKEIRERKESILASRNMEKAYELYEQGRDDEAQSLANDTLNKLESLGYVGTSQYKRYQSNVENLNGAKMAPSSAPAKDFLKKQKEEERKLQQQEQKEQQ